MTNNNPDSEKELLEAIEWHDDACGNKYPCDLHPYPQPEKYRLQAEALAKAEGEIERLNKFFDKTKILADVEQELTTERTRYAEQSARDYDRIKGLEAKVEWLENENKFNEETARDYLARAKESERDLSILSAELKELRGK